MMYAGLWNEVCENLRRAGRFVDKVSSDDLDTLLNDHPRSEHVLAIPVGKSELQVQVQHADFSNSTKPRIGPFVMDPYMKLSWARGLAGRTAIQAAVLGLPYSGHASGISVHPKDTSIEKIVRAYADTSLLGPNNPIVAVHTTLPGGLTTWYLEQSVNGSSEVHYAQYIAGKPLLSNQPELSGTAGRQEVEELVQSMGFPRIMHESDQLLCTHFEIQQNQAREQWTADAVYGLAEAVYNQVQKNMERTAADYKVNDETGLLINALNNLF